MPETTVTLRGSLGEHYRVAPKDVGVRSITSADAGPMSNISRSVSFVLFDTGPTSLAASTALVNTRIFTTHNTGKYITQRVELMNMETVSFGPGDQGGTEGSLAISLDSGTTNFANLFRKGTNFSAGTTTAFTHTATTLAAGTNIRMRWTQNSAAKPGRWTKIILHAFKTE